MSRCRSSPGTGPRRNRWPAYPAPTRWPTSPGMVRAVSEVRAVIGWIEPQATATRCPGCRWAVPSRRWPPGSTSGSTRSRSATPILGLNGMIARHLHRWGSAADVVGAAMASDIVTELTSVIDPLAVEPGTPPHRRLIVGRWHDQMAYRQSALALHERWGGGCALARRRSCRSSVVSVGGSGDRTLPARVVGLPPMTSAAVGCLPVSTPSIREWLTGALGATVTGVTAERIAEDSGFSALLYRLRLTGADTVPHADRQAARAVRGPRCDGIARGLPPRTRLYLSRRRAGADGHPRVHAAGWRRTPSTSCCS